MALQTVKAIRTEATGRREAIGLMAANADEKIYFPHADVPILDVDLLEDDYFEPDGVNDYMRERSWSPDDLN